MKNSPFLIAAAALLATGSACSKSSSSGALTVAGSTSVQPFAETWAEAFRAKTGTEVHVQGGGSTAGVQATINGTAAVGTCSRDLKPDEANQVHATVVARDGLTIIVHPSNPMTDITVDQIRTVFGGEVDNWSKLGGPDKRLNVVTREIGSGARGA